MAKRIRRGTLNTGASVSNLAELSWDDAYEFDRSRADNEFSGTPVEMSRQGSGTVKLLAGSITGGYQTASWVFTYYEVEVTNGVESVVSKTATFTNVTCNRGGSVPAEGRGEITIKFDYATCTLA